MKFKSGKIVGAALLASVTFAGAAYAGGFSRGTADTDILFEEGTTSRAGVTVISPTKDLDSFNGAPSSGYSVDTYVIPSFAAKFDLTNDLSCAGTFTTPFGGNSHYEGFQVGGTLQGRDPTSLTAAVRTEFVTREYGATCKYGFNVGKGQFSLLGGVYVQDLEYSQIVQA